MKVEIIPAPVKDRFGKEIPGGPERDARIEGVWPESTTEERNGSSTTVDYVMMVFRPRERPLAGERVRYRDRVYDIDGEPGTLEDGGQIEGVQVRLRRAVG